MSRFRRAAVFAATLLFAFPLFAAPWADLPSDRVWDPAWQRGQLANGVRFALRQNAEPRNRVSLRLLVSVGSLHENEDERGAAHFVEHMLFRGTHAYPGETLNSTLQRRGIAMGPDHTAFTGYDYTIYHIELPDTTEASLRLGLEALREYATAGVFAPDALEKERRVILNEKASRDRPDARRAEANVAFLWPNSRYAERSVIGTDESLGALTRDQLVAFYEAWYRPERFALIAVGDAEPERLEAAIHEIFGSIVARAAPRPEPEAMVPPAAANPNVQIFRDPGIVGIELSFQHPVLRARAADDRAHRLEALHRSLAFEMFHRRLQRIAADATESLVAPSASLQGMVRDWETALYTANGKIDSWERLAAQVEQEHRRVYLHGFTDGELARAKNAVQERLASNVSTAPSRRSESHAAEMAGALLHGGVLVTPEALRDEALAQLNVITLRDCTTAFRSAWASQAPHVFVAANPYFTVTRQDVARVLNESRAVSVTKDAPVEVTRFHYTDFGPAGERVKDEHVTDLDVRLSAFRNGVRLNFKQTPFETDVVEAHIRVGGGKLSAPPELPGLSVLAQHAFMNGGLGRHSTAEIRDLYAATSAQLSFHVQPDAFAFHLRSTRKDFTAGLQLLAAYLTDAGFRKEALRDAQASYNTAVNGALNAPSGLIELTLEDTLFGGDGRLSFPPLPVFSARTLDQLRQWMEPQLQRGAIELSVVGDIEWEAAAAAVGATLGALPQREERNRAAWAQPKWAKASEAPLRVPARETLKQVTIAWIWPLPEPLTVKLERRSYLLAEALRERLWKRLREELGATYSPSAGFVAYEGMPLINYFALEVDVDVTQAAEAAAVIRREIDALRKRGFSEDEFLRVKTPFLRARQDDLRENSYWGYTVLRDAQERPERLDAARNRQADTASITAGDVRKVLRRWISRKAGFLFLSEPGGTVVVFDGK